MPDRVPVNRAAAELAISHQTRLYSFFGAVGVGIVVFGLWWLMRPEPPLVAVQRRLVDLNVAWRCPNGHEFEAGGTHRGQPCPQCGRRADVAIVYVCSEHGEQPALVRYALGAHGHEELSQISFTPRVWRDVATAVRCPQCASHMTPKTPNPFRRTAGNGENGS